MADQNIRGIEEWIDYLCGCDFYEEIRGTDNNQYPGQFLRGHIRYPLATTKVLEMIKFDQENEMNSRFKIADYDPESAQQRDWPIKQLNLRSTDRLYIIPGKERTLILLKIVESSWIGDETIKLALCLPTCSFKSFHDRKLIVNIQLFRFPQYFYIKPSECGAREESVARLDLIQYVCLNHLRPVQNEKNNSNFKLSTNMLKLLLNHLSNFIFNKPYNENLEQEIKAYRDMMLGDHAARGILEE